MSSQKEACTRYVILIPYFAVNNNRLACFYCRLFISSVTFDIIVAVVVVVVVVAVARPCIGLLQITGRIMVL